MGKTIQAELPARLMEDAQLLVDQGWAGSIDELLAEALRRFLESHRDDLTERFIRADVEWGLRGQG
jgi:Arc/MetJ-type ribon-helix-helix transcriptional regulator